MSALEVAATLIGGLLLVALLLAAVWILDLRAALRQERRARRQVERELAEMAQRNAELTRQLYPGTYTLDEVLGGLR